MSSAVVASADPRPPGLSPSTPRNGNYPGFAFPLAGYFPRLPQPFAVLHAPSSSAGLRFAEGVAVMNKDRIAGSAKEIKGSIKEIVGKAVGDAKLESDGKADKVAGKVQNAIGGIKDALKR